MTEDTSPIAYSYIRMSTKEQLKGDSLRRQLEATSLYCKRKNLELKTNLTFQDLGVSARKGKNLTQGKLGALIQAAKDGIIPKNANIICESLDRLSRQSIDISCNLFFDILKQDLTLHTLNPESIYTKTDLRENPYKVIIGLISFIRAFEENEVKSERLKEAWQKKRTILGKGIHTKITPMWLSVEHEKYIEIPDRVNLINEIFDLYINGKGSGVICSELNQRAIPSFKGKTWNRSAVLKILNNESVLGYHQPRLHQEGRPTIGDQIKIYPEIVKPSKFYQAKSLLNLRKTSKTGGRTGDIVTNLFQGLMINKTDKSKIVLVNKGKKSSGWQLVQSTAMRGIHTTPYIPFPYTPFEKLFLFLFKEIDPNKILPQNEPNQELQKDLDKTFIELNEINLKIDIINKKIVNDQELGEILFTAIRELNKQKKHLEDKTKSLTSNISKKETSIASTKDLLNTSLLILDKNEKDSYKNFRFKLRLSFSEIISQIIIDITKQDANRTTQQRECSALIIYRNNSFQKFKVTRKCKYKKPTKNPIPYSIYSGLISEIGTDPENLPFTRGSDLDESYDKEEEGWAFVKEHKGALWDLGMVCYPVLPDGTPKDETEALSFPFNLNEITNLGMKNQKRQGNGEKPKYPPPAF